MWHNHRIIKVHCRKLVNYASRKLGRVGESLVQDQQEDPRMLSHMGLEPHRGFKGDLTIVEVNERTLTGKETEGGQDCKGIEFICCFASV